MTAVTVAICMGAFHVHDSSIFFFYRFVGSVHLKFILKWIQHLYPGIKVQNLLEPGKMTQESWILCNYRREFESFTIWTNGVSSANITIGIQSHVYAIFDFVHSCSAVFAHFCEFFLIWLDWTSLSIGIFLEVRSTPSCHSKVFLCDFNFVPNAFERN